MRVDWGFMVLLGFQAALMVGAGNVMAGNFALR